MSNVTDTMSQILALRNDVWLLWGLLATFNTALIGWLLEKGGSFRTPQKAIVTLGYALFCLTIAAGFMNTYEYLGAAVKDLKAATASDKPTPGGLVDVFSQRNYTNSLIYAIAVTGASFTFITSLVWSKWFWK